MKRLACAVFLALMACKVYDPLYCDADKPCLEPDRPFCDTTGVHPASGGIARTCIPDPLVVAEDAGPADAGSPSGGDGAPVDAGPCSWSRLAKLANVNRGGESEFVGSIDGEGRTLYFWRSQQFFRAERAASGQPFGEPVALEFDAEELTNPEVSGLELFFHDAVTRTIGRASRPAPDAAFVDPEDTGLTGQSPSLSGNGLSMYYVRADRPHRATRSAVGSPWSKPEPLLQGEELILDVDVSPDELRVLLVSNALAGPVHPLLVAERPSVDVAFSQPVPVDPAILFPEEVFYTYSSWTGDGRELIVTVFQDGESDLYFTVCR